MRGQQPQQHAEERLRLPEIRLGKCKVSRLIVGGNPIGGGSHSTRRTGELMNHFFTVERTTEMILHCEAQGITAWQSGYAPKSRGALLAARERGSKMQWFCLSIMRPWTAEHADARRQWMSEVLPLKPIAIVHHGAVTDDLCREGNLEPIHDAVKAIHDAGLTAGISTHVPENVVRIEDRGWEHDFYMTSFYNVVRDPADLRRRLGDNVIDELYYRSDPRRMADRIRQVPKTCLAFKILAAGRVCQSPETVERAFAFAFANIKPYDGVIVGMYPVFHDEVAENAAFTRKFGAVS